VNKKQQLALGINFLGLLLFVVWFVIRNNLPDTLSIVFSIIFLSLLGISLVLLIRAAIPTKEIQTNEQPTTKNK
jgi:hypothetical protein